MALDVSDDSKVLNIDMVHANIMQVDITMEDMKEEESVRWKWIKSNDWRDVDYNCPQINHKGMDGPWHKGTEHLSAQ